MSFFEKILIGKEKEIRILDKAIFHYGEKENPNGEEKYFEISPRNMEIPFFDNIIDLIGTSYDFVILMRPAGLGEAYLLCLMFDEIIKKNKAKNPCIVFHRKLLGEIFENYLQDIPIFYTKNINYRDYTNTLQFKRIKYKGITFQTAQCRAKDIKKYNYECMEGVKKFYPQFLMNFFGIKRVNNKLPKYSDKDINISDILNNKLNINNFVFLIPEANTANNLSYEFYKKLSENIKEKGIDVYVNTERGESDFGLSKLLSVTQALYLASKSRCIISVRTGLVELLSTISVPKHIIYPYYKNPPIPPHNFRNAYTLKKYPFVNPNTVFEYCVDEMCEEDIIKKIIDSIT